MKTFLRDFYPELLCLFALVVVTGLLFYFISLPNYQECRAHGFSLRFCLTAL